jgi:hypothetical protein
LPGLAPKVGNQVGQVWRCLGRGQHPTLERSQYRALNAENSGELGLIEARLPPKGE